VWTPIWRTTRKPKDWEKMGLWDLETGANGGSTPDDSGRSWRNPFQERYSSETHFPCSPVGTPNSPTASNVMTQEGFSDASAFLLMWIRRVLPVSSASLAVKPSLEFQVKAQARASSVPAHLRPLSHLQDRLGIPNVISNPLFSFVSQVVLDRSLRSSMRKR